MVTVNKLSLLLLPLLLTAGILGNPSDESHSKEDTGLEGTANEFFALEKVKLEAVGGFIAAVLLMICLLPKAVLQLICAKVHFDLGVIESLFGGGVGSSIDTIKSRLGDYGFHSDGDFGHFFHKIPSFVEKFHSEVSPENKHSWNKEFNFG